MEPLCVTGVCMDFLLLGHDKGILLFGVLNKLGFFGRQQAVYECMR